jgi:hypothetical protein
MPIRFSRASIFGPIPLIFFKSSPAPPIGASRLRGRTAPAG